MFPPCSHEFPRSALVSSHTERHARQVTVGILLPFPLTKALASELGLVPGCCTVATHCSQVTRMGCKVQRTNYLMGFKNVYLILYCCNITS
uniref:Uncharacterized protein n=1 Tax=Anguilla anguilla TaxID=7936 RepID=A0A0E9PC30_ANGAN